MRGGRNQDVVVLVSQGGKGGDLDMVVLGVIRVGAQEHEVLCRQPRVSRPPD